MVAWHCPYRINDHARVPARYDTELELGNAHGAAAPLSQRTPPAAHRALGRLSSSVMIDGGYPLRRLFTVHGE